MNVEVGVDVAIGIENVLHQALRPALANAFQLRTHQRPLAVKCMTIGAVKRKNLTAMRSIRRDRRKRLEPLLDERIELGTLFDRHGRGRSRRRRREKTSQLLTQIARRRIPQQ